MPCVAKCFWNRKTSRDYSLKWDHGIRFMASLDRIQDFLAQKRFAFVGVSRQPKDFSRALFREFRERGYDPIPVHLATTEIDGVPCFRTLQAIDPPVDSVLLMTPPAITELLLQDCAEAGIKRVWMYRAGGAGAVSAQAVKYCEDRGIAVIPGECPFMFFGGGVSVHWFHAVFLKITGKYPN